MDTDTLESGLGNLRQNALPSCQLRRLQRLVNAQYADSKHPVPFWIDTVCVPLKYPYRGLAINSMRRVYKEADKVLVLDAAITGTTACSLTATEMLMRLKASSWVRRLWTFHEAYLAQELHYKFHDVALTLSNIRDLYHRECEGEHTINLEQPYATGRLSRNVELGIEIEHIKQRRDVADPVWWDCYHFLAQVEVLGKSEPRENYARLRSIIHPLRWRTTSRVEDETICLSGCIDHTIKNPLWVSIDERSSLAIERMKVFLSSLQLVPLGLLFVDRPHIKDNGFRWMPTTFLGGGMDSTLPDTWQKEELIATGRPTSSGLVVTLPGIVLSDLTTYPQKLHDGRTIDIIFIRVKDQGYWIHDSVTEPIQWKRYDHSRLALILREELDQRGTFACLVTISTKTTDMISCRFESCVMVMGNAQLLHDLESVIFSRADLIDKAQDWCVA